MIIKKMIDRPFLIHILLILSGLVFYSPKIFAQDTLKITLQAAVDSAMNNNRLLLRYKEAVYEKEYLKKASMGNFFPSVDVLGGYTYFSKNPEINMGTVKESLDDMFGKYGSYIAGELGLSDEAQEVIYNKIVEKLGSLPVYNVVIDQQSYPNLNVVAKQPLFLGGKIVAGRKFAMAEYDYATAEYQKVSNEVTKETIERYYGVVLLQNVVKVREQVVEGMRKHEQEAERAIEIGVIPSHELLRAKVAVANAERDLIDDNNKLQLAFSALKASMGLPEETHLIVQDSLVFKMVPVEISGFKSQAFSRQPIFKMIEQKKLMVQQKHTLEASEFMPQIAAWGQYNAFSTHYPVTLPPFMFGIEAKINIFNGLKKYHKLQSTKNLYRQVEWADQYAHQQIGLLVEKTWKEVINKRERYLKMEPTVELARKNLEINEKRFREGLGKSVDVIDARLLYEGAEVERLKSLYDYYKALADLYMATGNTQKAVELLSIQKTQ